ncbi:BamA/OMP85 family outer membrane protein [Gabonibacter chumensis]|uniref:BamA/OMP85 family outer membrane protein n=1 Tax=Gabonibacter chumensis TaxID=2972474 RepID=UPI00257284A8|nr:POTRA domain-containing protein [Gabonibacter chumensis]MCR9011799.1 outer membrane protein assembly factor BamA [Gabonibacter chumensis]
MIGKTAFVLIFIFCFNWVEAQVADSTKKEIEIYYSDPKSYELAGVEITGTGGGYDKDILLQMSGLTVGHRITIPGDAITKAIRRLYDQGIFSDISVSVDRIEGDKVYLNLYIQGSYRLSKVLYVGLKKSEETKVREKLALMPGIQVTENTKVNIKRGIEKYLKEKGYYNSSIKIIQRDDPAVEGSVILDVIVEKNSKIKISDIIITGNKEIKAGKLKAAMKKTKEKSFVNFFKSANFIEKNYDEDKFNLLSRYNEKGYRDAVILSDSIVPVSPNRVKIYINLEEGNKYYFNDITWVGNTKYESWRLSSLLNIKKGDVYNSKYLQERLYMDEDAVSNIYQNNGYLFSRLDPIETIVGNDSINLEIRVIEGPQATINKLMIRGNTRTHEHVIRRELYTYPGELYSRQDVIRSIRELANMGHFDPEKIDPKFEPHPEAGTTDIIYNVSEKPNDKIELSGGWGAGMIIGSLGLTFNNFSIRNIFNWDSYRPLPQGDGQTFSLKAQTNGKYYTSFSISFREPWLGGKRPNSLSVSAYFSRQTGYSRNYYNSYYVNSNKSKDFYNSSELMLTYGISVGLGRRITWPDDWFTMYNEISYQRYELKNWPYYIFSDGNSNNLSFATVLKRSSIDNPLYTKQGSEFTLSLAFTPPYSWFDNRDYATEKDRIRYKWIEYHKWKFSGKVYVPLTDVNKPRPLVLYASVQYGYLGHYDSDKKSPFEGFEMGGDGMSGYSLYGREYIGLRGYENGSLTNAGSSFIAPNAADASLYSKITMEIRYPISLAQSATIYALGFLEAGNSWYKLKDFEPFNLYRSAGVGLRVFLPMFGLLGIDWGYGFDEVPGRSGAAGSQIHFVLGQEF